MLLEAQLARCIDETVRPFRFKRLDPVPLLDGIALLAAWKRKTLNMNRGIALVALGDYAGHPGALAVDVKKTVGKSLGYIPFLYELGLQLVLVGKASLHRAVGLHRFLDTVNTQTVVLQSIHLIDMDARELVTAAGAQAAGFQEELGLPDWARALERLRALTPSGMLLRATGLALPGFEQMAAKLYFSQDTGRAALSVRTWAQSKTGPFIDAIEAGIQRFLAGGDE